MADEEPVDPDVRKAAKKASVWLQEWAKEGGHDLESFSPAQWFMAAMKVPCSIRCWRVGVSIEVEANKPCPECGKTYEVTVFDRLLEPDPF